MKIKLFFFGKKSEITQREKELMKRLNFRCKSEFICLSQAGVGNEKDVKKIEAEKFLSKLPEKSYLVVFDERGRNFDSVGFSEFVYKKLEIYGAMNFLIGGAYGVDDLVKERADVMISLGTMVWTRELCRTMVCEQLYRALEISAGSNFHKV